MLNHLPHTIYHCRIVSFADTKSQLLNIDFSILTSDSSRPSCAGVLQDALSVCLNTIAVLFLYVSAVERAIVSDSKCFLVPRAYIIMTTARWEGTMLTTLRTSFFSTSSCASVWNEMGRWN